MTDKACLKQKWWKLPGEKESTFETGYSSVLAVCNKLNDRGKLPVGLIRACEERDVDFETDSTKDGGISRHDHR
jgi:hypothetical protein